MKQSILTAVILCFLTNQLPAQLPGQDIRMRRINEISQRFVVQKNDPSRLKLYGFFAAYLMNNNIYPNADAIDLVDAYNKQITYEAVQANQQVFRTMQLNHVPTEITEKINSDHYLLMKQLERVGVIFKKASVDFDHKLTNVSRQPKQYLSQGFRDSLLQFNKIILPGINGNIDNIQLLQIQFFLNSLQDINRLMDQLDGKSAAAIVTKTIEALMDDFFVYKLPVKKIPGPAHPNALLPGNKNIFSTVVYRPVADSFTPLDNDEGLPNANVYVYTRGTDGKWSQQPKAQSFNVYYGANGLKYSLTPGCDTLSFFKFHPLVPASPLPVTLAWGNYCFVLQDISNNRLYLKPDINLQDNKVVDDKQLIILCFKVDN